MTDLQVPMRTEPTTLPAPTMDVAADSVSLPPPPLRVPAVSPPALAPLNGSPIVPPMPRFSLDEVDASSNVIDESLVLDDLAVAPDVNATPPAPDLSCPPFVEAAPMIALVDGDAPPSVAKATETTTETTAATTTETTVVETIPGASPSERLGAPPAIAMVMPSLPSVSASPPPSASAAGPPVHHPTQAGGAAVTSLADALHAPAPKQLQSGTGVGKRIVRTVLASALAAAIGAGAHLGYDWWETRDTIAVVGVDVDGTDLASWPQVDPPAIRYTDTVTVVRTSAGVRTLTAHREIASGHTQATVQSTDALGVDLGTVEIDLRGEQSFVRATPESSWAPTPQEAALAQIGDTWTSDVFTVSELFPAAALPYTTVLESVERVLPVRPLVPAVDPNVPVEAPMAISTDPTSMVWQYRVIIDVESFRANETVAYQEWSRRLGRNAAPRIEAWVDATGIVRQIALDVDGTVVTHTLVGGSADSTRFDADPLVGTEPVEGSAVPVVAPAPVAPAPDAEVGG